MAGLKYWLWLSSLQGLSGASKHLLLEHFASPESVYYADEEEYRLHHQAEQDDPGRDIQRFFFNGRIHAR